MEGVLEHASRGNASSHWLLGWLVTSFQQFRPCRLCLCSRNYRAHRK